MNLLVSEVKLEVNRGHDYSASYEVAKTETLACFCCNEMAAGNVINWRGELVGSSGKVTEGFLARIACGA